MAEGDDHRAPSKLAALAARAQLGDLSALDRLLEALQRPLFAHVRQIVLEEDVAADVLQETLFTICRKLSTLREVRWVRPWAYRIATRQATRSLRRRGLAQSPLESASDIPAPEPAERWDPELIAQLPTRLGSLPPAAQIALRLHYLDELTQPEVAEVLEIPVGTVKSRISYGLSLLRQEWEMEPRTLR